VKGLCSGTGVGISVVTEDVEGRQDTPLLAFTFSIGSREVGSLQVGGCVPRQRLGTPEGSGGERDVPHKCHRQIFVNCPSLTCSFVLDPSPTHLQRTSTARPNQTGTRAGVLLGVCASCSMGHSSSSSSTLVCHFKLCTALKSYSYLQATKQASPSLTSCVLLPPPRDPLNS
jgi:hypothetical protein